MKIDDCFFTILLRLILHTHTHTQTDMICYYLKISHINKIYTKQKENTEIKIKNPFLHTHIHTHGIITSITPYKLSSISLAWRCVLKRKKHTHTHTPSAAKKRSSSKSSMHYEYFWISVCVFVDNIIARIGAGSSKDTIKCKYFCRMQTWLIYTHTSSVLMI